ncbi:heat shock factor 2-binding protein-like [Liolophura sinensis]|uniref:heat shock factor 2-binding protein-like n=1 Tax=Liolophura sinensis TaxID=3198878 RepID=UPI00315873D7
MLSATIAENEKVLVKLVNEVSSNHDNLVREWHELKRCLDADIRVKATESRRRNEGYILVKRTDLQRLCSEIIQLKQILPKVVDRNYLSAQGRVVELEEKLQSLHKLQAEVEKLDCGILSLKAENEELKMRFETSVQQNQAEKQENRSLRQEVSLLCEQLSQQSEYCTGLGTACCTLLWRVSRNEQCVQTMLTGGTIEAFLSLVPSTLESYLSAYKNDWPKEDSPESKFVMALCGTVTNIAASAFGREFLMNSPRGVQLVETCLKTVAEAPRVKAEKLKCLLIMALYNLTINQKGLEHLSSKPGMVQLFTWLLKDEQNGEIRLHSLHLIQSLICDEKNTKPLNEFIEMQPAGLLQKLTDDRDKSVSQAAMELLTDLEYFCSEP